MTDNGSQIDDDGHEESTRTATRNGAPTSPSRRRVLGLLGAGAVTGIAGCTQDEGSGSGKPTATQTGPTDGGPETGTPTEEERELQKSATIGVPFDITDDFNDAWGGVSPYYTRILEPLAWSSKQLQPKPWLAKEWERTGELTWEVTLRQDVKFHNGATLTPEAVQFSMEHFGCCMGSVLNLKGSRKARDFAVRKVDGRTVEFTTRTPSPRFPSKITHQFASVQHPDRTQSQPIGTGPYKFEEIKPGQWVKVSAFEDYWGESPKLESLTYRVMSDQNTRTLSLTGHEIDVGINLSASQIGKLKNSPDTKAVTVQSPMTSAGYFNTRRQPTDDIKLRKALNYALDQEKVVKGALNGVGEAARGDVPKVFWWSAHDSLPTYGPDVSKAKRLVEESSYAGETLEILVEANDWRLPNPRLLAQIVQQSASNVGVDTDISVVPSSLWSNRYKPGDHHIALYAGGLAHSDTLYLVEALYHSAETHPWILAALPHRKVDGLIERARTADNRTAAKADLRRVQQIVMDRASILPLVHQKDVYGMFSDIGEAVTHPFSVAARWEHLEHFK